MLNLKTLVLGAVIAAASAGAMAQPGGYRDADRDRHQPPVTRGIDARQSEQAARIDAALRSGSLSRHEYRALKREQVAIQRYEARAKADGVVTRAERRELQQMLDRASRHIRRA